MPAHRARGSVAEVPAVIATLLRAGGSYFNTTLSAQPDQAKGYVQYCHTQRSLTQVFPARCVTGTAQRVTTWARWAVQATIFE